MPRHGGAVATGQQAKPVGQPQRDLVHGQHPHPGGGQFDGQRQTVQAPDDLDDVTDIRRVDAQTPH